MAKANNFGNLPKAYCRLDHCRIAIVPVPYDRTSTWLKGADKGPAAIIEASANMELYDIETDSEVYKHGIFTDRSVKGHLLPQNMIKAVERRVLGHIDKGRFTVVVGGEHSVSIGSVRAHARRNSDMTVLQLDAHADLRDEYDGSRYNHACVMARLKELCPIVQVGIRSMDSSERKSLDKSRVLFAEHIHNNNRWIDKAVARLSNKVYITVDLDVFDPAIMPSTGTPEPGGLLWYDVLKLLKAICLTRSVVGFDVAELSPNENNKAPDFLAAKLIYTLLSYRFKN